MNNTMMTEDKNAVIKWVVFLFDAITLVCSLSLFVYLFPQHCPRSVINHVPIATTLLLVTFFLFSVSAPLVIHNRVVRFTQIIRRNFAVVVMAQAVFALLWHMMTRNSDNEMLFNLLFCFVLFFAIVSVRLIERELLKLLRASGRNTRSVLFIGSDPANLMVYNDIMLDATTGYRVLGYYSNDVIENAPESLKKLGSRKELRELIAADDMSVRVDEIYCSLSHDEEEEITNLMRYCNKHVIRFFYVPRMQKNIKLSLKPQIVGGNVLYTNFHEPLAYAGNRFVKRAFDVVFSLLALICIMPFVPIIAAIIKIQSPGPVFFKQLRSGLNGKDFMCYKFRSMHVNDQADTLQATEDDSRKFPFGDFMRRTNIDELPQFYNVLRGDMSIVGPRPHMLYHTEIYSALIEKYMVRHFAKPGVTGLAQISGYRGETSELSQMEGRIKKDIEYIEHWSIWYDIKICLLTVKMTFLGDEKAF